MNEDSMGTWQWAQRLGDLLESYALKDLLKETMMLTNQLALHNKGTQPTCGLSPCS